ncbi:MAG TPA: LiaF domain-containing protein [Polyangiaceae bacterium]|jgi:hypothetical protein
MEGEQHPKRAALRAAREKTIEQLTTAFTRDELSLAEFEARLDRAYAVATENELPTLVSDLSAEVTAVELTPPSAVELAPLASETRMQRTVAILGSVERRGHWTLARASGAKAVLGSVVIDLRDVALQPGVTTLEVSALLGSVEIIVPPQLAVESFGSSILGSFESLQRVPRVSDPELPVLRVTGRAVLGSVEVYTRPEESRMRHALLGKR